MMTRNISPARPRFATFCRCQHTLCGCAHVLVPFGAPVPVTLSGGVVLRLLLVAVVRISMFPRTDCSSFAHFLPADPSLRRRATHRPSSAVRRAAHWSIRRSHSRRRILTHRCVRALSPTRAASQPARGSPNAQTPRKNAMEATSSRRPGHSPRAPASLSRTLFLSAEFSSSTKPHSCQRSGDRLVACCLLPGSQPARRRTTLFGERTTE